MFGGFCAALARFSRHQRAPTGKDPGKPAISAIGTPHAKKGSVPTTQKKVTFMKTLSYLSAALFLSLSLMVATVVVPVSAAPFIA